MTDPVDDIFSQRNLRIHETSLVDHLTAHQIYQKCSDFGGTNVQRKTIKVSIDWQNRNQFVVKIKFMNQQLDFPVKRTNLAWDFGKDGRDACNETPVLTEYAS